VLVSSTTRPLPRQSGQGAAGPANAGSGVTGKDPGSSSGSLKGLASLSFDMVHSPLI
jgi:hypothetical protein